MKEVTSKINMLEENADLNESLDKKLKATLKLRNSENFEKLC